DELPFHARREAGPAATAEARGLHHLNDIVRLRRQRLLQRLIALVLQKKVERVAVWLADVLSKNRIHRIHSYGTRDLKVAGSISPHSTFKWQPESAATPRVFRSSTSLPHDSGVAFSCHCSLFTMTTGARSQAPRHSNSSSVNVPDASVSPTFSPSFSLSASVTRSAPASAHDSVRHTCSTYLPTGAR